MTRPSSRYQSGSPTERVVSAVLSTLIILLLLVIAVLQTQVLPKLPFTTKLSTFDIASGEKDSPEKTNDAKTPQPKKVEHHVERQVETPSVAPVVRPEPQPTEAPAFTFLKMSRQDMASADLAGIKSKSGGSTADSAAGGGSVYGPGAGPGGAVLYKADWFREPTDAQLGTYVPAKAPPEGWGLIACQTIDHYRVENCEILGESPAGSGYGRAVLNAAWQFQIVPPRLNGKPQMGAWVSIRIDYTSGRPNLG